MKVGMIVPGGVDRSGRVRVIPALLWLIERLAARHEVHVFALYQDPTPEQYPLLGATVHNIGARPVRPRTLAAIYAEHGRGKLDVLHAFWAVPCGVQAVLAGRALGIPVLTHLAGGELASMPDIDYGGRRALRGRAWVQLALAGATRLSAASLGLVGAAAHLGFPVVLAPLGVDVRRWPPRAPRPRNPGARAKLLHVASLNRVKDQRTLIRAAANLARRGVDFQLDIVGEDTLGGAIHRFAEGAGGSAHITFHGFKTQDELRPLVEEATVLVMSSRHEAGPVVALEAAIAGVPTVGTAVGHIADWAPERAVAVPVADAPALAGAVQDLLADEPRRMALAAAAQRWAMEHDADWTARRFEAIYAEIARS